MKVKDIAISGIVAAIYIVLTVLVPPIAFGALQFRFSEVLTLLCFYNRKFIPGLTVACLLSNLASPFGLADILLGTLATFLALYLMSKIKNIWLASLMPAIFTPIIVAGVIAYFDATPALYPLIAGQIALSQFIICTIIGVPFIRLLDKYLDFENAM